MFQLNAIVAQVWLIQLRKRLDLTYTQHGPRGDLQRGYAWRSFLTFFEPMSAIDSVRLFENLLCFANLDGYPPARAFFLAYAPLAFEHDEDRRYIGPGVWSPVLGPSHAARRIRRTLRRWCEWLEALEHYQVHARYRKHSPNRSLDETVILFWPLLKRHGWTTLDLLHVLRDSPALARTPPCQSESHLAAYCRNELYLRAPALKHEADYAIVGRPVDQRLLRLIAALS